MAMRSGKGSGKVGRNKSKCERYRNEYRIEKNRISKLSAMIENLSPGNKMRLKTEIDIRRFKDIVAGARL